MYVGELCNTIDTNNLDFIMLIFAYVLACIIKLFNDYNYIHTKFRVEAKMKDMNL